MNFKSFILGLVVLFSLSLLSCTQDELIDNSVLKSESIETLTKSSTGLNQAVTKEQALHVANLFLERPSVQTRSDEGTKVKELKEDGKTLVYVINYDRGGFALVSGSTDYYPVLAYSDKNHFEYRTDMHPGLLDWLDFQKKIISGEYTIKDEDRTAARAQWLTYLNTTENVPEIALLSVADSKSEAEAFAQRRHEIGLAVG